MMSLLSVGLLLTFKFFHFITLQNCSYENTFYFLLILPRAANSLVTALTAFKSSSTKRIGNTSGFWRKKN
jgi:hypothetical protein